MKRIKYTIEVEDVPTFTSEDPTKILYYGTAVEDYDRGHEEAIECVEIADSIRHKDSSKTPLAELAHFVAGRLEELENMSSVYDQLKSFYTYLESTPTTDYTEEEEYIEDLDEISPEPIEEPEELDKELPNLDVSYPEDSESKSTGIYIENITEMFTLYSVPFEALKSEVSEDYDYAKTVIVSGNQIDDFSMAEYVEFDREGFADFLHDLFDYADFAGFIGYNFKANWQNKEAYKTSELLVDLFDYSRIDLVDILSPNALQFRVSNHDVPTGGDYYVIGVEDREEYINLVEYANFEEIRQYVESIISTSKEEPIEEETTEYDELVPEEDY